jgi:hypothetical protein
MTAMTLVTDSRQHTYRTCRQSTQTTCGPASCLIMWANVFDADPEADEGGVIALSRMFDKPWNARSGADIGNLTQVLRQMGVAARTETIKDGGLLRSALHRKVHPGKPALAFAEWEVDSTVVGHFIVIAYADAARDAFTFLDPAHGKQEPTGIPFYYPSTDDAEPPVLKLTGAVTFVD